MADRIYPMAKPEGFVPAVQRYSARLDETVSRPFVQLLGAQVRGGDREPLDEFLASVRGFRVLPDGPMHLDYAHFVDDAGFQNQLAFAYWPNRETADRWWASDVVSSWWTDDARVAGPAGYFVESVPTSSGSLETIAFRELVRGLAACPVSHLEPMGESGYWGAARDRISGSATDRFDPPDSKPLRQVTDLETSGRRITVSAPPNHCVIRSGVSWEACGEEQLTRYRTNVLPRLNEGMQYLRENPIETGCWSLRQVDVVDDHGWPTPESWVTGHFVSLEDLERWAHHHPTHLAIFGQAQKERVKYQDDLELRTYHEVYIVDDPVPYEYVNCHPSTGALGLLPQ